MKIVLNQSNQLKTNYEAKWAQMKNHMLFQINNWKRNPAAKEVKKDIAANKANKVKLNNK